MVVDQGGPVITHADVDLIFWGSGWDSAQDLMNQVTDAVNTIMNSPYLSGLSQYRGIGDGQLLRTDILTSTSPAAHTTDSQFDAFAKANIDDGNLPVTPDTDGQILYMVIPQPGTTDPSEGAGGAHGSDGSTFGRFHYGWSENTGSLDDITKTYSHELTEAVTDPEVNFHTAFIVPSSNNEISDGPAQNYSYRLDGVLVQSSLSQQDHAYDVYDGNTDKFVLTNMRALTVDSDQFTDSSNTATIDVTNSGYTVNVDGEFVQFDPGQVSSITLNALPGDNTVNVEGTLSGRPVTINLGDGTDTVNLSPTAQNLSSLAGTVTINGGSGSDTLNLFDQGTGTNQNYTLTQSTVTRPSMATLTYRNMANVTLNTSNGADTIAVQSTPSVTVVAVHGGSGPNTLVGSPADNTWSITGNDAGTLTSLDIAGPVSFTSAQNLTGGAGSNTFVFGDGAGISGNLDGGGAGALDYSAYRSSVIVDLQTGSGTGVAGSIAHIQNVTGGTGGGAGVYNVLVGDGGNILTGGNGRRNLLIAGSSASTLIGGDDDDILVGGTTAYDMDPASLMAIMDYWSGTSDDYAGRVSNLLAGDSVPLLDLTTVMSNGGNNTLTGGPGLNLYYGNASDITDYDATSAAVFIQV